MKNIQEHFMNAHMCPKTKKAEEYLLVMDLQGLIYYHL